MTLIESLLKKDRDDRIQSAKEVHEVLRRVSDSIAPRASRTR